MIGGIGRERMVKEIVPGCSECLGDNIVVQAAELGGKFSKEKLFIDDVLGEGVDQILEHEEKLYPEKERYTREQLEEIFEKWGRQ